MKLWGKTLAEIDAEHREILAAREAKTPRDLGNKYTGAVERYFHFGTDIPAPTMEEAEMAREQSGTAEQGRGALALGIVSAIAVVVILAGIWAVI